MWSKQQHEQAATGLLAKADQYKAAGNKEAVKTLMIQVQGHRQLAGETDDPGEQGTPQT